MKHSRALVRFGVEGATYFNTNWTKRRSPPDPSADGIAKVRRVYSLFSRKGVSEIVKDNAFEVQLLHEWKDNFIVEH